MRVNSAAQVPRRPRPLVRGGGGEVPSPALGQETRPRPPRKDGHAYPSTPKAPGWKPSTEFDLSSKNYTRRAADLSVPGRRTPDGKIHPRLPRLRKRTPNSAPRPPRAPPTKLGPWEKAPQKPTRLRPIRTGTFRRGCGRDITRCCEKVSGMPAEESTPVSPGPMKHGTNGLISFRAGTDG